MQRRFLIIDFNEGVILIKNHQYDKADSKNCKYVKFSQIKGCSPFDVSMFDKIPAMYGNYSIINTDLEELGLLKSLKHTTFKHPIRIEIDNKDSIYCARTKEER